MVNYRKEIQVDENINTYLKTKNNVSEYLRGLILNDMNEQTSLLLEKNKLQQEEQQLKEKLMDVQLQIHFVDHQIEELNNRVENRPDGYDKCVERLLNMTVVSVADLDYQANLLEVDSSLFKQWLFNDGVFEKLLR